jgi:hypothetical protein
MYFLIIKPSRCTNFSNLFWKWNSICFGQFLCPSPGVIHCKHTNGICHTESFRAGSGWNCLILLESCLQTCMTYTIAECTVNNSWWWTEDLSETCRVSFQNKFEKLVHLGGFIIRKFITTHGHMNVKKNYCHILVLMPDTRWHRWLRRCGFVSRWCHWNFSLS